MEQQKTENPQNVQKRVEDIDMEKKELTEEETNIISEVGMKVDGSSKIHPLVLWAQRRDKLVITVNIPGVVKQDTKLTDDGVLKISAQQEKLDIENNVTTRSFGCDIPLREAVTREGSAWDIKGRYILIRITKVDQKAHYWPRLYKGDKKNPMIKTDWDRYCDSDDEDGEKGKRGMKDFQKLLQPMEGTNNAVKLEYGPGCEIETMEELQEILAEQQIATNPKEETEAEKDNKEDTESEGEEESYVRVPYGNGIGTFAD